jgi:predicted nuclease of predicted toxin-antitoxin system
VKLLLDENISDKIAPAVDDLFPGSTHVKAAGLMRADDSLIADWAEERDFTIVSKDTDFYQRAVALGLPSKFIWLRVGNCTTATIIDLVRTRAAIVREFIESETESVLILERT